MGTTQCGHLKAAFYRVVYPDLPSFLETLYVFALPLGFTTDRFANLNAAIVNNHQPLSLSPSEMKILFSFLPHNTDNIRYKALLLLPNVNNH